MTYLLGKIIGCPCCGPRWYARMVIRWHRKHGYPIPPELAGYA